MNGLLAMMLLAGDKPNQKALLAQILPAVLPGPPTQRMAIAAITAREQIRKQAQTEQGVVLDAIKAGGFKTAEELGKYPAIEAAFKRLPPAVQSTAFPAPPPAGDATRRGSEPT
jgi:hypothetical protein